MIRFLVSLHSAKSSRKTADRVGRGHDRFSVIVLLLALSAFGCSSDLDSRLEAAYKLQESGNVEQMIVELQNIRSIANKMKGFVFSGFARSWKFIWFATAIARNSLNSFSHFSFSFGVLSQT